MKEIKIKTGRLIEKTCLPGGQFYKKGHQEKSSQDGNKQSGQGLKAPAFHPPCYLGLDIKAVFESYMEVRLPAP